MIDDLSMVRPLFALTLVLRLSTRQIQFKQAVFHLVSGMEYFANLEPPPDMAAHRQSSRFLVDALLIERGARMDFANPFSTERGDELRRRADTLCELLAGPWRSHSVQHFCPVGCKCGGTREKAVAAVVEVLLWLFTTLMPVAPSVSRWATLGPACAWLGICLMVHGLFRRAWLLAFSREAREEFADLDPDDAGIGAEAFHVAVGRRIKRARDKTRRVACHARKALGDRPGGT